jgi:hypothetical protein
MSNDAQDALGCLMSNAARVRVNTKFCSSTFTSPTHATSKQNEILMKIIYFRIFSKHGSSDNSTWRIK